MYGIFTYIDHKTHPNLNPYVLKVVGIKKKIPQMMV